MCTLNGKHVFERSGLAALSDLSTREWHEIFRYLEEEQASFLEKVDKFRSPEYRWPRDPLHTWSRAWEYVYAYYHLKTWRDRLARHLTPRVVDFGSGVTFFPFVVAKLGCHVICVDIDPVCQNDLECAASCLSSSPGTVESRLSTVDDLPLSDGQADAVYCISVLEHISDYRQTIGRIRRTLKPGALFVLTIDLDLRGDQAVGKEDYHRIMLCLRENFDYRCPAVTVHPSDMLRTDNGPYAMRKPGLARFLIRESIRRLAGRPRTYRLPLDLTVEGLALVRRT